MAEILGFARVMVVAATGNDATFVSRAIPNQMRPDETQHISITVMNTGGTTWTVERLHRLGAGSLKTGNPHNNGFGWSNFASGGYSNNVLDQRAFLPKTVALGYTVTFAFVRSFSVGIPDVTDGGALWRAFYPAIDAAKANGGVLGLHEYSAPTMQNQFDESSGEGWLTGRYRKVYRYFLIPDGKTIPLIITECGIDGGVIGQAGNG